MNVEDAYDIIFNFINKCNGIRADYIDKHIGFTRSENVLKHINYIAIGNHMISIVIISDKVGLYNDKYFGIHDFIKLLIFDNTLDDVIIEFEKELFREFR